MTAKKISPSLPAAPARARRSSAKALTAPAASPTPGKALAAAPKVAKKAQKKQPAAPAAPAEPPDMSNPFLRLINPKGFQAGVAKSCHLGEKEGLVYSPVESSPLHRPKRMYVVKQRDALTGELQQISETEFEPRPFI